MDLVSSTNIAVAAYESMIMDTFTIISYKDVRKDIKNGILCKTPRMKVEMKKIIEFFTRFCSSFIVIKMNSF
eukprot:UN04388